MLSVINNFEVSLLISVTSNLAFFMYHFSGREKTKFQIREKPREYISQKLGAGVV